MTAGGLLGLEAPRFQAAYGRSPISFAHRLVDHELLTLEALAGLAERLAPRQIEHNVGTLPDVLGTAAAPRRDLAPGDLVRSLADNDCWMVLKWIETDPDYRQLLDAVLDEVEAHLPSGERVLVREGFVFLSAPGSVTPSHVDPEDNLLLQIRGTKTMTTGGFATTEARDRALERFHGGGGRNLTVAPYEPVRTELGPGDGIYVPVHTPHLVHNGPTPSVSLSCTFTTTGVDRLAAVYKVNDRLRGLGLSPSSPGARPGLDRTKQAVWRAPRSIARAIRGRRSGAGSASRS